MFLPSIPLCSSHHRDNNGNNKANITHTKHTAFIVIIICYFLLLLFFFYATKLVLILDFIYFSFFLLYFFCQLLAMLDYGGCYTRFWHKSLLFVSPNFQLQTNSRNEWLNNNWMKKRHQPNVFAMNDQQTTDQRSQPPKSNA